MEIGVVVLQIGGKKHYFRRLESKTLEPGDEKWITVPRRKGPALCRGAKTIRLPRRHEVRFVLSGVGRIEAVLRLNSNTPLASVARWFGANSRFTGNQHLNLAVKHLHGRLEEIAKETAEDGEGGLWTDRATAAVQAINPSANIFLPGKIYRVTNLEILQPQKLVLADE